MKYNGLSTYRFKDNPEEQAFAEAWSRENERGCLLEYLLDKTHTGRPICATDREHEVAATVIQWLGSPVGQNFLEKLGYRKS